VIDKILDRAISAARAAGMSPPMRSPAKAETSREASIRSADPKKEDRKASTSGPLFGTDAMSTRMVQETRQRVHDSQVVLKKTAGFFSGPPRHKQSD